MKKFLFTAIVAGIIVVFTANDAEARGRRLFQPRYPRVISYWSPGVFKDWFTQGSGGPKMAWRGDWVPAHMVK